MDGYGKVEKELRRLGWKGSNASGDHVKFRKDGHHGSIIVSRSLSDCGTNFRNKIAQIRRKEPEFRIVGRRRSQTHDRDRRD